MPDHGASLVVSRCPGESRGPQWRLQRVCSHRLPRYPGIEVDPIRVALFNQLDLSTTPPTRDPPFARHRRFQCFVAFEPDQSSNAIICSKPGNGTHFMLPHSSDEVGGRSDIQGSVQFTREQIYKKHHEGFGGGSRLFAGTAIRSGARRRGNPLLSPSEARAKKPGRPRHPTSAGDQRFRRRTSSESRPRKRRVHPCRVGS
jgi:hypothetical protein